MSDTVKIIAQISPSAAILTDAYTVSATSATLSSVCICNATSMVSYFRISVAMSGNADDPSQYLYYDLPLDANDTFIATIGLTLANSDVIRVQAASNGIAFNFFGIEMS